MNTSICSRSSINSTPLPMINDPGYSVYLIYQKEVYNCDHAFLQSLMDWIYTSNESPYKFIFRNRAFININHYGIILTKDKNIINNQQSTSSIISTTDNSSEVTVANNPPSWNNIHFNLKHLKEIYVDKRHKDTCVLVSKVSSSSANNIYVWKKTNPSNYQTFRSPYALNNAYKKSYLLTIIKFKDGPTRLLQSIQLLDRILADYNRQDSLNSKKHNSTSDINNSNAISSQHRAKLSISDLEKIYDSGRCQIANKQQMGCNANSIKSFNSIGHGATKANNRFKPSIQQYFNDYLTRKLLTGNGGGSSASCIIQSQHKQQQQLQQHHQQISYSSTSSTNMINSMGHCSLKNNHSNSIIIRQPRRLSVDNSNIFLNNNTKLNNPLYSSSVNNSNVSLQSFCNNCNLPNKMNTSNIQPSSFSLSRHSSINEIATSVHYHQPQSHQHYHHYHHSQPTQQLPPQPFINRSCNIVKTNSINSTIGLNINRPQISVNNNNNNNNNKVSNSVPASPAPRTTSANGKFINVNNNQNMQRQNAPTPCQNCHHLNCYYNSTNHNHNHNHNNTSIENLNEINYQQLNRKFINLNPNNNNFNQTQQINLQPRYSVSSTSSLNQTGIDLNKSIQNTSSMLPPKSKVFSNKIYPTSNLAYPQVQQVNLVQSNQASSLLTSSLDLSQNNNNNSNNIISKPTVKRHSSITSTTKPTHLINHDLQNQSASNILIEVKNNLNKVNKNELDKVIEKIQLNSSSTTPTPEKSFSSKLNHNKNCIFTLNKNEDASNKKTSNVNKSNNSNCDNNKINKHLPTTNMNESTNNISPSCSTKESNNKVKDIIKTFNNFNSSLSNSNRTSAFTSTLQPNILSPDANEENCPQEKIIPKSATTVNIIKNVKTTIEASIQSLNTTTSSINNNVKSVCQTITQISSNNAENSATVNKPKSVKNCINNWNNNAVSQINEKNESTDSQNKLKNEAVTKSVSKINKIAEKLSQEMNKNMNIIEPQNKTVNLKSRNSINLGNINNEDENSKICTNKTNILRGSLSNSNSNQNQTDNNKEKNDNKKEPVTNMPTTKVVETIIQNLKSTSTSFDSATNTKSVIITKSSSKNKNGEKSTSTRKRTFANMNWPIDPEEEKILRSSSPYVVPEVIVQRNERVKSILKKNNFTSLNDITNPNNESLVFNDCNTKDNNINSSSITIPTTNSISPTNNLNTSTNNMASPFSNKKRVDFRENFCMVNFFETHKNEHDSTNSRYVRNITGKAVSILNKNDNETSPVEQETTKISQNEEGFVESKVISND